MDLQFNLANIKPKFIQTNENIVVKINNPQIIETGHLTRDGDLLLGIQNNEPFPIIFTFYDDYYSYKTKKYEDKLVIQSGKIEYFNIPIILVAVTQKRSLDLYYKIEKYDETPPECKTFYEKFITFYETNFKTTTFNVDFIYGYVSKETRIKMVTSKLYCYKNKKIALYFGGNFFTWIWSACMIYSQCFDKQFDINNATGFYQKLSDDEYVEEFIKTHKNTWTNFSICFVNN